jgi:two-component system, chemotaxis family, sensor kinase CheA
VTAVSGRGVGMDVVRTNIEKIGGSVDLQSEEGRGTSLIVKIPLTLAIIPALIVACGPERYAIPQVNLVELLRLDPESGAGIETVAGAPVYRLRGRLLPVLHLREILDGGQPSPAGAAVQEDGPEDRGRNLVVLQADDRRFGLVVDHINDTEEIVVKPLAPQLKSTRAFAGTTIMGDGAIALILDAIGLAQLGNVLSEQRERAVVDDGEGAGDRRSDTQAVIVCSVGAQRIAIPLALVDRLEEFDPGLVERTAGREVIQYRGQLLTLVHLSGIIEGGGSTGETDSSRPLQVLVFTKDDRIYGFVVDEIVDILETDLSGGERAPRPTVEFSGVIGRRVTDVLNIDHIIDSVEPSVTRLVNA